jgi:hypothetical protein
LTAYLDRLGRAKSAPLGRGLGMTDDWLYDAAAWSRLYGGLASLSLASNVLSNMLPVRTAAR